MAAASAPYYFRFRIWWCHSLPIEGQRLSLSAKQILSTYIQRWLRYNYFRFGKTTVRHIEILLPFPILTISSYSACDPALGCQISSESVHHQRRYDVISIFKMAADAAQFYFPFQISWRRFFRISVSISKPNFVANSVRGWDINFCFRKTNVRQIGNLHPVSILTTSLQSACHSAPVCEILSKSDSPRQ